LPVAQEQGSNLQIIFKNLPTLPTGRQAAGRQKQITKKIMKELFNTLSNVSDFFAENRYIYQRKTPKPNALDRALQSKLTDVFPVKNPEIKKLIDTSPKKLREAQKKGREMERRAKEKFGRMDKSPKAIARSEEYKRNRTNTITKLVGELAQRGPESNWNKSFVNRG